MKCTTSKKLLSDVLLKIRNCLTYRLDILCIFVWDRYFEFFFKFHDKFNRVERVSAKVIGEAGSSYYLRFFNT